MFKNQSKSNSDYQESIGKGSIIQGDITSQNNFRLDGTLTGSLTTAAKVVTGVESTIEGVLKCTSACISGKVDGTIKVDGLVDIKKTAVITGELFAKSLQVEEGAVLEATCNIQSSKTKKSNLTKVAKEKQSA